MGLDALETPLQDVLEAHVVLVEVVPLSIFGSGSDAKRGQQEDQEGFEDHLDFGLDLDIGLEEIVLGIRM